MKEGVQKKKELLKDKEKEEERVKRDRRRT